MTLKLSEDHKLPLLVRIAIQPFIWLDNLIEPAVHRLFPKRDFGFYFTITACLLVTPLLGLLAVISLWPAALYWGWNNLRGWADNPYTRFAIVLSIVLLAWILDAGKRCFPRVYGVVEILVGSVVCWQALTIKAASELSVLVALGSGIYVIVRGIDNMGKTSCLKSESDVKRG
ncbi:hypothetical protein AYO47_03900 [Planctomyces sp. SCGC AG-212-M04]|nr:hypothetical protein AYO47_03900 [Planctomyces sp. SCGC AG-212-M04]